MSVLALLLLAASARAQSPMPYSAEPSAAAAPAVSTAPAASTEAVVEVPPPPPPPPPKPAPRVLRATIHKDAKDWEPVSLRAGGDADAASTGATLRLVKSKGKYKGAVSKAVAVARVRRGKSSMKLTIAVFPKALETARMHLEVRLRIVEGFVEDVEVAAVTIRKGAPLPAGRLDAGELRRQGVEFSEETPSSGAVAVSALDPRAGKKSFNSGELRLASFTARELGFVSMSWAVNGVEGPAAKR